MAIKRTLDLRPVSELLLQKALTKAKISFESNEFIERY